MNLYLYSTSAEILFSIHKLSIGKVQSSIVEIILWFPSYILTPSYIELDPK